MLGDAADGITNKGDTVYYCMDVDSSENIIVGGASSSTSLVSSANTAIVGYYTSSGQLKWIR